MLINRNLEICEKESYNAATSVVLLVGFKRYLYQFTYVGVIIPLSYFAAYDICECPP
jgi:hypothetical protein